MKGSKVSSCLASHILDYKEDEHSEIIFRMQFLDKKFDSHRWQKALSDHKQLD